MGIVAFGLGSCDAAAPAPPPLPETIVEPAAGSWPFGQRDAAREAAVLASVRTQFGPAFGEVGLIESRVLRAGRERALIEALSSRLVSEGWQPTPAAGTIGGAAARFWHKGRSLYGVALPPVEAGRAVRPLLVLGNAAAGAAQASSSATAAGSPAAS
ncbi:hypothetical protein COC42_09900 [Sphingomonas spermidinifaciens]|uniref:Uncharacterized protein n=1 Tax=Sphingomonas spermidinifaciens TaxID=1141889 RepID=A0A2A4B5R5_9SPHN|nr:hypothetical protein [Sphingomonas spermidinifaciens]PCD04543.1 hypothetical protein COC42_09900 [Sphingomonas spermidinifaciens]